MSKDLQKMREPWWTLGKECSRQKESQYKGPEAEAGTACSTHSEVASVVGQDEV